MICDFYLHKIVLEKKKFQMSFGEPCPAGGQN